MKKRYKVLGTRRFGNMVRLVIELDELVKEKLDSFSMIKNPQQMLQQMQEDAMIKSQPDTITILYEEWQKHKYNTDDIIWIELTSEKH